jgi:hypothetical protein
MQELNPKTLKKYLLTGHYYIIFDNSEMMRIHGFTMEDFLVFNRKWKYAESCNDFIGNHDEKLITVHDIIPYQIPISKIIGFKTKKELFDFVKKMKMVRKLSK